MPRFIDREEVLELRDDGVPIIDVLPPREHEELRIAGAVGIWLRRLDAVSVAGFDKSDPLVVYCHDPL